MAINIRKCAVLSVCGKSVCRVNTCYFNVFGIVHHNSYKDLGITICQNVSFIECVNDVVSKAWHRVSMIFRGFISRDCEIMQRDFITLYSAYY
jgi:hypothetical protein